MVGNLLRVKPVNKNFNLFILNEVKGALKIVADSATIRLGCT